MNFLKNITSKRPLTNKSHFKDKEKFLEWFFTREYHAWMLKDDQLFNSFQTLLEALDLTTIEKIWQERDIAFIKAEGTLSCAIDAPSHLKFILCFPELVQFLKIENPELGIAILLHELGHMYHLHNKNPIDPLKAQFQADEFAYFHGYGEEIIEVINDYRHLEDNRKRILNIMDLLEKESKLAA